MNDFLGTSKTAIFSLQHFVERELESNTFVLSVLGREQGTALQAEYLMLCTTFHLLMPFLSSLFTHNLIILAYLGKRMALGQRSLPSHINFEELTPFLHQRR